MPGKRPAHCADDSSFYRLIKDKLPPGVPNGGLWQLAVAFFADGNLYVGTAPPVEMGLPLSFNAKFRYVTAYAFNSMNVVGKGSWEGCEPGVEYCFRSADKKSWNAPMGPFLKIPFAGDAFEKMRGFLPDDMAGQIISRLNEIQRERGTH